MPQIIAWLYLPWPPTTLNSPAQRFSSHRQHHPAQLNQNSPMLLLQYHNILIQSILQERFAPDTQPANIDQVISDFDNVTYHVSTPESKTKILISLSIRCFKDLEKYGATALLKREYGEYVVQPENGYDFSIVVDLENLPSSQGK